MAQQKLHHISQIDVDDSGILTEVAIVKKDEDGSIFYINTEVLHPIDKARLKKIVISQHADKYSLWELLSQARLSNGMNALDYFHYNFVKCKRAPGSKMTSSGLSGINGASLNTSDNMIGSDFTDPFSAEIDGSRGTGITSRGL